ncbi:MAG: class I SAM-dependent methyltransferase [Candidatus Daviesbacteria bacterium]|nr:class I SAM-dependent methyltransferase [Candidatus Daviesbacteria bacterium]
MSYDNGTQTLESMSQAVWYNQWILNKFKKFLNGEILEVGCGIGNFTKTLVNYGKVWTIDINSKYIEKVQEQIKGAVWSGYGDIEKGKYFFNNQKFDTIICSNVLEHIKGDEKALKNLYYLLNKGGILVLLVPAHDFLFGEIDRSIGHYRRYNKERLSKQMTQIGFKIINERILNMLGGIGWWFSSKLLGKTTVESSKVRLFNLVAPFILPFEDIVEPPIGTSILIVAQKP